MTFGQQVREIRKTLGVTLRELARRLDIDPGYLSRMENDRPTYLPARKTVESIVLALGLSRGQSDRLHVLARKLPGDVEEALLQKPELMGLVRVMVAGALAAAKGKEK